MEMMIDNGQCFCDRVKRQLEKHYPQFMWEVWPTEGTPFIGTQAPGRLVIYADPKTGLTLDGPSVRWRDTFDCMEIEESLDRPLKPTTVEKIAARLVAKLRNDH